MKKSQGYLRKEDLDALRKAAARSRCTIERQSPRRNQLLVVDIGVSKIVAFEQQWFTGDLR
jgi:hypothetical protein